MMKMLDKAPNAVLYRKGIKGDLYQIAFAIPGRRPEYFTDRDRAARAFKALCKARFMLGANTVPKES